MGIVRIVKSILFNHDEGEEATVADITCHAGVLDITYGFKIRKGRREWASTGYESEEAASRAARASVEKHR